MTVQAQAQVAQAAADLCLHSLERDAQLLGDLPRSEPVFPAQATDQLTSPRHAVERFVNRIVQLGEMRYLIRRICMPARARMPLLHRPRFVPAATHAFAREDVERAVARSAEEVSDWLFLEGELLAGAPDIAEDVLYDLGGGVLRAHEAISETTERVAVCSEYRFQRPRIALAHARGERVVSAGAASGG